MPVFKFVYNALMIYKGRLLFLYLDIITNHDNHEGTPHFLVGSLLIHSPPHTTYPETPISLTHLAWWLLVNVCTFYLYDSDNVGGDQCWLVSHALSSQDGSLF